MPKTTTVLCEEFQEVSQKGRIIAVEFDGEELSECRRVVLEADNHLSYPFAFLNNCDDVFMIPEAAASGKTTVFSFNQDGTLKLFCSIDRRLADPTIVRHKDRYWLFACDEEINAYDALVIYWSDRLEGPWLPHFLNPVKIDIRSSRPAGALFYHNGRLLRPAQDCSRSYGAALTINEILELTPASFRERTICHLQPESTMPHGLHTFCLAQGRVIVDGKRLVIRPLAMIRRGVNRFVGGKTV
jgi:hypothetical protein